MSSRQTESASVESAKRAAGEAAAERVRDGTVVGLGTGSTTAYAIRALGLRRREEDLSIRGVATSFSAERLAREASIPLVDLEDVEGVDLAIDGADEVGPGLDLVKGRGGAHTRERVVAADAREFLVVADYRKEVRRLGTDVPVPVEVVPMAVRPVRQALAGLGGDASVRRGAAKDGPVVTDQGLWILDVRFAAIDDPEALARAIKALPGVLDHGLFVGIAARALIGERDGSVRERTQPAPESADDAGRNRAHS